MRVFVKHISWAYLKYFFIIFFALELFFVAVDALNNIDIMPRSANLIILYLLYSSGVGISIILPLSIVLSFIICFITLIRSGELVAFYALGVSKNQLIMPVFLLSVFIVLLYILLQSTPMAYAKDLRNSIGKLGKIQTIELSNIFFKHQDKFIYFENFDNTKKQASSARIFELKNAKVIKKIISKDIKFQDNKWIAKESKEIILPINLELGEFGFRENIVNNYEILQGFEPQILSNLNKNSREYSVLDAIYLLLNVKDDSINLSLIKTSLYSAVFFPFFASFMILILYYYLPTLSRFTSLALTSFAFIISTLCVWGIIYVLIRFSISASLPAEFCIILPICALGVFAGYKYNLAR